MLIVTVALVCEKLLILADIANFEGLQKQGPTRAKWTGKSPVFLHQYSKFEVSVTTLSEVIARATGIVQMTSPIW